MRRFMACGVLVPLIVWFAAVAVPAVRAFPLTTCTLTVTSTDASGATLSTATGGGAGGTQDDPLLVDPKGTVQWTGSTGVAVDNGTYHVAVFGVPTPISGSIHSSGATASGSVAVGDILPFDLVGLVYVSGGIDSGGTTVCDGSGWIKLQGDPVGTPGFVGGVALSLIGLATVLTSAPRRRPIRGIVGGLIGGVGLALLSGATSFMPLGDRTPLAEVVGALVLGLVIGVIDFASLFRGGSVKSVVDADREAGASTPATGPDTGPATTDTPSTTPESVEPTPAAPVAPAVVAAVVETAPVSAPATGATTATPPEPGLPAIRAGVANLPDSVRAEAQPILERAERILAAGPGTLTIDSQTIAHVLASVKDAPSIELQDGALVVQTGLLPLRATPVVSGGQVSLSFLQAKPTAAPASAGEAASAGLDRAAEGLAGLIATGAEAAGASEFKALDGFLANINTAVANAHQVITSVNVTPGGITVTTGSA